MSITLEPTRGESNAAKDDGDDSAFTARRGGADGAVLGVVNVGVEEKLRAQLRELGNENKRLVDEHEQIEALICEQAAQLAQLHDEVEKRMQDADAAATAAAGSARNGGGGGAGGGAGSDAGQ